MADLLLELFSEEIPARMQRDALVHLSKALLEQLQKEGFALNAEQLRGFVTPRRVAVSVSGLPTMQSAVETELKGPKIDAPAAAIEGFLKKNNLARADLTEHDGVFFAMLRKEGKQTDAALKAIIEAILAAFPWPKSMRWGGGETRWVRPLHSILCLFDGKVVPMEFADVKAGKVTYGHRFLSPSAITVSDAAQYEAALTQAHVIADREARKARIKADAEAIAAAKGLALRADEGLLEEVTGLVEWPVLLAGTIDAEYMDLPPEVLVSEMRAHQKYFALQTKDGALSDTFLITANTTTADDGKAVIAGNERVLRARLSDGRFFWDQDRKKPLEAWAEGLGAVTYHAKLGTIAQKVERVTALALSLAEAVGADKTLVERAAKLSKADLVTGMVGEFPELQGVMGRYYALAQKEAPQVADAIRDHYKPLGPGDAVPTEPVAVCVALADKLDTLAGMFAIGEKPTGSKDPFALRRAALGVIRIILENGLRINLSSLATSQATAVIMALANTEFSVKSHIIKEARSLEHSKEPIQLTKPITMEEFATAPELMRFLADRLKVQLKDQGLRHDLIAAVFDLGEDDFVRLVARVKALQAFLATDDGANLLAAYKRAANILAIEEKKDKRGYHAAVSAKLLSLPEEQALHEALAKALATVDPLLAVEDFTGAMGALSSLRAPVDTFFDKVLVNDKDTDTRANRLNLLAQLRATLDRIANFALIEG